MPSLYSYPFANSCLTGFIEAHSPATGQLDWSKDIAVQVEVQAETDMLLSSGNIVIINGIQEIFAFDKHGNPLWQRPKWYGTPISLKDDWIYYTSAGRKTRMEAIDLNNKVQLEDLWIPDVGEEAFILFFEPMSNGLIAQVQYIGGGPGRGETEFIVYKIQKDSMVYDWSSDKTGYSPLFPLVSIKHGRLVTTTLSESLVFDINSKDEEPDPIAKFPLPLGEGTMWVSCGTDGLLYWTGLENGRTVLVVSDLKGEMKWRWDSERRPRLKQDEPVAPPIITLDRAYLLSRNNLYAVKEGKLLWSFEAKEDKFTAGTALADNSVLVTAGKKLYRVGADGKGLFELSVEETIVTSPVIDEDGHIYVASSETLYAIH